MPQSQIVQWKRGDFHTFYAQMKIRVGGVNGNQSIDILAGDEFEYDGSIVKYAGAEFPQPGLRGAVRDGWATLDPDGQVPAAFTAARSVAKSQTINRDLSRVQRAAPVPMESDSLDEETVLEIGDRSAAMDPVTGKGHLTKDNNRRKASMSGHKATLQSMHVTQSDLDQQDHTPIAKIKSKANLGIIDITKGDNSGLAREIETRSHESGYGAYSGPRRGKQVVEREGVIITTNVGDMNRDVQVGDEDDGVVVGKVRHTDTKRTREGVDVQDTSGSSGRHRAAAKSAAKPVKKAMSKPAAKPAAKPALAKKSAAKPVVATKPAASPSKLRIAKKVFSGFPDDWNFFGKTEDKMARLEELGSDPDLIDALFASESSSMKSALQKAFPDHFA